MCTNDFYLQQSNRFMCVFFFFSSSVFESLLLLSLAVAESFVCVLSCFVAFDCRAFKFVLSKFGILHAHLLMKLMWLSKYLASTVFAECFRTVYVCHLFRWMIDWYCKFVRCATRPLSLTISLYLSVCLPLLINSSIHGVNLFWP